MKHRAARRHQARLLLPKLAQPEGLALTADRVSLDRDQAHHLFRVLRLQVGGQLELLDGSGHCYKTTIISLSKDQAALQIEAHYFVPPSALQIQLIQGLSAADHMDFSLQKGVELGLNAFLPVNCERSVSRIDNTRAENKVRHWQMVAQAACMQSANPWLPIIHQPQDLASALHWTISAAEKKANDFAPANFRWMLDPYANQSLIDVLSSKLENDLQHTQQSQILQASRTLPSCQSPPKGGSGLPHDAAQNCHNQRPKRLLTLLVGPEAGLSDNEVLAAKQAGFDAIHLGPRTLRTETAAMAAIAAIQAAWGDWAKPSSPRWTS